MHLHLSYKPKAGSTKKAFPRLPKDEHSFVMLEKGKMHLDPKSHTPTQKE